MDWWQSLNIYEHILLAVAIASTLVILTKAIMTLAKFYSIDKLNSEAEDLELYEKIANNDSDIVRHTPRFISVVTINVFLASGSLSYFIFRLFLDYWLSGLLAVVTGVIILILYAVFDSLVKKIKIEKEKKLKKRKNNV